VKRIYARMNEPMQASEDGKRTRRKQQKISSVLPSYFRAAAFMHASIRAMKKENKEALSYGIPKVMLEG
jgi:hypothetical protein